MNFRLSVGISAGFVFSTTVLFGSGINGADKVISHQVSAEGGRRCWAHLLPPWGPHASLKTPLVIQLFGNGLYSSAEGLSALEHAHLLTLDRPGIVPDRESPRGFVIEEAALHAYTQQDLVSCLRHAIDWALSSRSDQVREDLIFVGHSEGAQIILRYYLKMHVDGAFARNVRGLFLSGTPLVSWKTIVEGQKRSRGDDEFAKYQKALDTKDDAYFAQSSGTNTAYLREVYEFLPLIGLLRDFFKGAPALKTQIHFFHGLRDKSVEVAPVMKFEDSLSEIYKDSESTVRFRYYLAEHGLNATAGEDISLGVRTLIHEIIK